MRFPIFQVDAFTDRPFRGNPAAVCPLETWPDDDLLQAVAAENNLSETAFLVPDGDRFELRWFTPEAEVDLCGHATLAAGFVVLRVMEGHREDVVFETASGPLAVRRDGERLAMDFPAVAPEPCGEPPPGLAAGLGRPPERVLRAKDWLAVYASPDDVGSLEPDTAALRALELRGVIATAARASDGEGDADFVSRFFAPKVGVPEDPVTGSAHCTLAPYWSRRLGRGSCSGGRSRGAGARSGAPSGATGWSSRAPPCSTWRAACGREAATGPPLPAREGRVAPRPAVRVAPTPISYPPANRNGPPALTSPTAGC